MAVDFIPTRLAVLVGWSNNFEAKLSAAPADYGIHEDMALEFNALHATFIQKYNATLDPLTRNRAATIACHEARRAMVKKAREIARIVNAVPGMDNATRVALGLNPRTEEHAAVPAPAAAPGVDIERVVGNTIYIQLHDADTGRRAVPENVVTGTVLFGFGDQPPTNPLDWVLGATSSRTRVSLTLPIDSPRGARVWIKAYWSNRRQMRGPESLPIPTNLQNNGAMAA